MNMIKYMFGMFLVTAMLVSCDDDGGAPLEVNPFITDATSSFVQQDQMGRPAVNTVFISSASKDNFNVTVPSQQGAAFQSMMQTNLQGLSPAFANASDQNALGLTAAQFTGLLATDVLNVSLDGKTTFFDGTNVLTGRALTDDVISVELTLIFGGETGLTAPEFPGLSDDNVDANDKQFLASFPYLASPW